MKLVVLFLLAIFPLTSFATDLYRSDLLKRFKPKKAVVLPKNAKELKFSNTQKLDARVSERVNIKDGKYLKFSDWKDAISLPPPPANTSNQTKKELAFLMVLQKKRNAEHEMNNKAEIRTFTKMGPYFISDVFMRTHNNTVLSDILSAVLKEVAPVTTHFKMKFDRPRPHVLASELRPNVFIPAHPAYPSGSSVRAYLIAETLSLFEKGLRKEFMASAFKIARNREISGVHYPSDSEAGKLLARQVMKALLNNGEFKKLALAARKIWAKRKQEIQFTTPQVR